VANLLAAADIFVFPSFHENMSNALLEGMAAGLPVVASAVGGNVEVLERGGGILVPKHDARAFREALVRLVEDGELRISVGREARRNVGSNYSLDSMVDGWDRVYRRVLAKGDA
jgi:glycosyltransferase involved in cell wall biosynthesis